MAILVVLKPIEDANMLYQPRDKSECAFAVLHAEIQLGVLPVQVELVMGEPVLIENASENLRNSEVLVDPAVHAMGQEPEPRSHLRSPEVVAADVGGQSC